MFHPKHFLEFSKCLLDDKPIKKNEAYHRNIISRSYYSSLLSARETLDNTNINLIDRTNNETSHTKIINAVTRLPTTNVNATQLTTIQKNLQELKIYRINADYKFPNAIHPDEKRFLEFRINRFNKIVLNPETKQSAEYVVKTTERIVDKLDKV